MSETKTLNEVALENLIAQGMKEGSNVKVLFKVPSYAHGWRDSWMAPMDAFVGSEHIVTNVIGAAVKLDNDYWFPAFCLELVPESKEKTVRLNEEYSAVVCKGDGSILVGCQHIPIANIVKVVEACKELGVWPEETP